MFVKHMTKTLLWLKIIWAALSSRSNQAFYDKISAFYDDVYVEHEVHARKIIDILNEIYKDNQNKTLVLDLGCGTGMMTALLTQEGFKAIGIDISLSSLCVHQDNYPEHLLVQADANFLPIDNGIFDSVVCLGVWRHFADINKVLNEVSRVLKDDGTFIVGYFPPAMAGSIDLNQKWWGRLSIRIYHFLTRVLGYVDRADFTLEKETLEIARKKFKSISRVQSDSNKYILLAKHPLKDAKSTRSQEVPLVALDQVLRCPFCMSNGESSGKIKTTKDHWLVCQEPGCNRKYPKLENIPVLLNEEGKKWMHISENDLPYTPLKP